MPTKKMYKSLVLPIISLVLIVSIFFGNITKLVYASTVTGSAITESKEIHLRKDETVYGILDSYGDIDSIYVVNHFPLPNCGIYVDYGSYSSIENLTNLANPSVQGDRIKWDLEQSGQGFYYKGKLANKELPWQVEISYFLDGEKVDAGKLGGAEGIIEIEIGLSPIDNDYSYFVDNYFAQIQVPINKRNTKIISADGASKVILGETVNLAYTVLPKDTVNFKLKLESTNFDMDGIDILLSPFTLADSLNLEEINEGFHSLGFGMKEINEGTLELQQGMYQLSHGIGDLNKGQKQISDSGKNIMKGMDNYNTAFEDFNTAMPELVDGSIEIKKALDELATEGEKLADGYNQIAKIAYDIEDGIMELVEEIRAILPDDLEYENLLELVKLYIKLFNLEDEAYYALELLVETLVEIEEIYKNIKLLNEGLNQYTAGVSRLAEEYHVFHGHIEILPEATNEFSSGFNSILRGNRHFIEGVYGVGFGLNQLDNNIKKVPKAVGDLAEGQRQIKEGLSEAEESLKNRFGFNGNSNDRSPSFVSPKIESVESVQFILKTPAINGSAVSQEETLEEEKKGFFSRLLDLFRL